MIDVRGDVVGFGSRVLDKSEPKYMNTPETPYIQQAPGAVRTEPGQKDQAANIILCEGNLDVVTLHQAGSTTPWRPWARR